MIYEYSDKSPQGCAVTGNYDASGMAGKKRKRRRSGEDFLEEIRDFVREKRDVRTVKKFIELALVMDKAMVSGRLVAAAYLKSKTRPFSRIGEEQLIFERLTFSPFSSFQFELREDSSRKEVIHDAIQVANIADLVSSTRISHFSPEFSLQSEHIFLLEWQSGAQKGVKRDSVPRGVRNSYGGSLVCTTASYELVRRGCGGKHKQASFSRRVAERGKWTSFERQFAHLSPLPPPPPSHFAKFYRARKKILNLDEVLLTFLP